MEEGGIKRFLTQYWYCFYFIVALASAFDYVDHVTRPGSVFSLHKIDWFLFTFFSTVTLALVIGMVDRLNSKLFKTNLLLESLSIIIGILAHVYLTGPMFNKLFFEHQHLNFYPNVATFGFVLGLFYLVRLIAFLFKHY